MPSIIELEDSVKTCPFDGFMLQKIIYFSRQLDLDTDEEGENLKDRYICMHCGYEALFLSPVAIQDILNEVKESLHNKAELLDQKEKMRDSRRNHVRIKRMRMKEEEEESIRTLCPNMNRRLFSYYY